MPNLQIFSRQHSPHPVQGSIGPGRFGLFLCTENQILALIGVIYRPETELASHYFHARLTRQFVAIFHYDTTRAVEPLERTGLWERGEFPETWPTAL